MVKGTWRGTKMILYQNIYHMLAYAFQVLNEQGYKDVAVEEFENTAELLAAILCKGVAGQIKRGLLREYITTEDTLVSPRGKIEISETVKTMSIQKKQLVCKYDEFSINAYCNRIIKTTFLVLLKGQISKERKKEIKRLLAFLDEVNPLDIHSIQWIQSYNRNNQTYKMIISVCYMIIKGLLQTTTDGNIRLMEFLDEQRMCRLYEKFIFEYFKRHHKQINVSAATIPWVLDSDSNSEMLPTMQSDIMLSFKKKILIIDAKYYSSNTQQYFDKHTIHSNNLYQIFAYVKNKEAELYGTNHEVSGMLLYAKTDEAIQPNNSYWMSGNRISVKTLDLNQSFDEIKKQLDFIANDLIRR